MKLLTLLGCLSLVAAAHAATFKMPIISLAHQGTLSLSNVRVAAMVEAGEARARKQASAKEQTIRRHRKSQMTESAAIGVVENDAEYMDFIRASSTLKPPQLEEQNLKPTLPLWVNSNLLFQSLTKS